MMRPAIRTLIFLAAGAAFAQPQPIRVTRAPDGQRQPMPQTAPEDRGSVSGRITSATSGEPLRKVNLTLRPQGRGAGTYTATSDADGRFQMLQVEPGRYVLAAEKAGFVRTTYGQRSAGVQAKPVEVGVKQNVGGIDFKMTPQGVIAGRISDEDGDPVQGAQVQVHRYVFQNGQRRLAQMNGSSSNDQGEFRIANLPPGRYYLSASRNRGGVPSEVLRRQGQQPPAEETGYVQTFFPGTIDLSGAAPMDVAPGSELRGIDIRLMKTRMYRIRGVVTNLPAAPGAGRGGPIALPPPPPPSPAGGGGAAPAMVAERMYELERTMNVFGGGNLQLVPRQSAGMSEMHSRGAGINRQDGSFEFTGVLPGAYYIIARANAPGGQGPGGQLTARVPVDVANGSIDGITVALRPGVELTGTVKFEGASTDVKPGSVRINLSPIENSPGIGGSGSQGKEDGTFVIRAAAEKYMLNAGGLPDGYYLKAVKYAGRDVLETGIDLTSGGGGQIEVLVSANSGEAGGRVETANGEPAGSVMVTLVPAGTTSRRDRFRTATTDESGNFRIKSLAPGEYKVYAWEEIEPGAYMDPGFRQLFDSWAGSVKIAEKSSETVTLKAVARDAVEREMAKMR